MNLPDFSAPRPRSVMVVMESQAARNQIAQALRAQGHHVAEAAEGESALSQMANHTPDIVIIDDGAAPGARGEFLDVAAQRYPRVPFITVRRDPGVWACKIAYDRQTAGAEPGEALLRAGRSLANAVKALQEVRENTEAFNRYL